MPVDCGVVKMNVDTDTQYAFTRPIAEHMFRNVDGVLKVDGDGGNKKLHGPRSYGRAAEDSMTSDAGMRGPAIRRNPPHLNAGCPGNRIELTCHALAMRR